MASKSKKKIVKKVSKTNLKEIKYLEKLLSITKNCIDNKSEDLDKLFLNQAKKLETQIQKLKE